jgi:MFS family permease
MAISSVSGATTAKVKKRSIKYLIINILFFASFFTFYYVFSLNVIPLTISYPEDTIRIVQAGFSLSIVVTLLVVSHLIKYFEKKYFIIPAIILLVHIPTLFFLINPILNITLIIFIGVSFGIIQLAAYTFFWNTTNPEERGRIGGIIGLISLPIFFILYASFSIDLLGQILICISLSAAAIIAVLLLPKKSSSPRKVEEYYPEKRTILLYSLPWILFSFLNATLAQNISASTPEHIYFLLVLVQTVAALFGTLGGGFLADYIGRRPTLALGVSLYGVSMTFRGFISNDTTFIFAFIAEGLSWGIFLTLYSFVVWGDLANSNNCSKVYSIGLVTFYFAAAIGRLPSFLSTISFVDSALISCLIIFLSYIPLVLAPESLSSDIREKNRLKRYMKTLRKIAKENDD